MAAATVPATPVSQPVRWIDCPHNLDSLLCLNHECPHGGRPRLGPPPHLRLQGRQLTWTDSLSSRRGQSGGPLGIGRAWCLLGRHR